MFIEQFPIANLTPASYNPRLIDDAGISSLRESLQVLGMLKPIICTDDGLIVAGHQRTKAMCAEGYEHCPAYVLTNVNVTDEVRFNQLHNASDLEIGDVKLRIPKGLSEGWHDVPANQVVGLLTGRNAARKSEILRLLAKYGPWGAVVATQSGEILVSGLYAASCIALGIPVKVRVIPSALKSSVEKYFGLTYGRFSYNHLPKTTWAQSLAQMMRLREPVNAKVKLSCGKSRTYSNAVMPHITKAMRVLDFGAGQMDYVNRLRKLGYQIRGLEFYYRSPGSGLKVDVAAVHLQIDGLCRELKAFGRFDMVICDSVLNSVDSVQAESDVMYCLNALCKPDGWMIFSGRSRRFEENQESNLKRCANIGKRYVNFIDSDGLSAMYRSGVWVYQKFHYLSEVHELAEKYTGNKWSVKDRDNRTPKNELTTPNWIVIARKAKELALAPTINALNREFDLPLPDGASYRRGADILSAWQAARDKESENK